MPTIQDLELSMGLGLMVLLRRSVLQSKLSISRKSKLKAAVKKLCKDEAAAFNRQERQKVKQAKDVKKKKEILYKKPPIKTSVTKAQKASIIQAAKRKEVVDISQILV